MSAPLAARIRLAIKALTPPLLWNALKALKDRLRGSEAIEAAPAPSEPDALPEWEYVPEGWARERDPAVKGWDVAAIVKAYRGKWPSYLRALEGAKPLGVYHEVVAGEAVDANDRAAHNMLVSYAYVLALAARKLDRVSILDWGGGIGHYYPLSRAVLPDVEIEYHCKDVPRLAAAGRELFPDANFYDDDAWRAHRYDLVLASGSLQYARDWTATLSQLGAAAGGFLYVTRLPVALAAPSFVVLQRAYAYGYDTEYLGWVVNRDDLVRAGEQAGLELVREFLLEAWFSASGAPEDPIEHRGFLWRPATREPETAARAGSSARSGSRSGG